jgi:hypothetical protein
MPVSLKYKGAGGDDTLAVEEEVKTAYPAAG